MRIGQIIAAWRAAERIGVRGAAKQIGIGSSILSRVENGENCDARSLAKILAWVLAEIC